MKTTMEILINGQARAIDDDATLATLLDQLQLNARHVAVEVNLQLIPRAQHAATVLRAGDVLEVVTLVGGG